MKRTHQYRLRLSDYEWEQLQYLKNISGIKISDVLRKTIDEVYEMNYISEPTELEIKIAKNLTPALLIFAELINHEGR